MKKFKPNYSFADLWKQFVLFTKNWRRKSTGELVNKDTLELGDVTANDIEVRDIKCRKVTATGEIKTSSKVTATGQVSGSKFVGDTALETIKDSEEHFRFVEGDITIETITGVTQTYGKWSLSGTHLMIVLAGELTAEISSVTLATITLPEWVVNKIVPISLSGRLINSSVSAVAPDESSSTTLYFTAYKSTYITIKASCAVPVGAQRNFRIQIDLLIDNTPAS